MKDFWPELGIHGLNRFINPVIEALNEENYRLPKYIIIFPDRDLMSCIRSVLGDGFRAARVIGAAIHYLIRQINMLIDRRRLELSNKHPGAVINDPFPKIVWVRMIKRPKLELSSSQELCALRGKFNSLLEERLNEDGKGRHFIMSIEVKPNEFDLLGYLSGAGKINFWKECDRAMKKFDSEEISLKPRGQSTANTNKEPNVQAAQVKLPTPPSKKRLNFNIDHTNTRRKADCVFEKERRDRYYHDWDHHDRRGHRDHRRYSSPTHKKHRRY